MRIAALILGILGGIIAAALGIVWLSDYYELEKTVGMARALGADTAELDRLVYAAYLLLASFALGIAGGILALKHKGRVAAALMMLGPIAAGVLAPKSLVFSFLLLIGGLLAFFVKGRQPLPRATV